MRKHRLVVLFCSEQLAELKRSIDHELRQRDEDTNVVRGVGATDHRHAVQPCRALINACHVRTGIASRALTPAQLDGGAAVVTAEDGCVAVVPWHPTMPGYYFISVRRW